MSDLTNAGNAAELQPQDPKTFSILAIVFGALSLLFVPIVLGPTAIILAAIAFVKKEKMAPVALAVSIVGMLVGMFIGALVGLYFFG